jgi:hypothetical protein
MTIKLGTHLVEDVAQFFRFESSDQPIVTRAEFNAARYRLARAGMAIRSDGDTCWAAFADLRSDYASRLNAMAQYLLIPPTQWIGDRSAVRHVTRVDEMVRQSAQAGREAASRALVSRGMPQIQILDEPPDGTVVTRVQKTTRVAAAAASSPASTSAEGSANGDVPG